MAAPTVKLLGGVKWVQNHRDSGDGFDRGNFTSIETNGASFVVVFKPLRNGIGDAWDALVDLGTQGLAVGVRNSSGAITVFRKGTRYEYGDAAAIPDGQTTILSCIFQEDGSFKIYANGVQIVDNTSTGDANLPLNPIIPWYAGAPQSNNWASHINLGRTNGAGWASENGYIGDVFVYTSALSDTDRMQLEADLTTKFITNATLGYTITASAGPNGSIDPSGATPVIQGENLTYTITQGTGAVVADVLVDGVSVGPVNSYTFASVSADHTIDATFLALPNQTIEASSGANGSISPSGVLSVVADSSQTFTITPDPDFKVDAVLVDGVSVGPVTSYTFAHVVTAHTIAASFKSVFLNGFAQGYARMLPMTFGSYVGAETLVNFPALVRLSEAIPGFLYGDVLSNGADLRFTAADGTELSYEIDTWNPDGESLIWVQVPAFMNGTTIKMFYGKSGDTPPAYTLDGATWSEGYHGVWHMNTAGAADAGQNALDATGVGNLTAASGQIGTAQAITNPGADYARTPGFTVGQKITVSTWVQGVNGMSVFPRIITNNYGNSYYLGGDGSTPRQWLFIVNGNFYAAPTPIAEDGTWQYAAATFENGTSSFYINGVYVGGNTGIGLPADNSSSWGFGANSGGGEGFKGSMDEVHRSAQQGHRPVQLRPASHARPNRPGLYGLDFHGPADVDARPRRDSGRRRAGRLCGDRGGYAHRQQASARDEVIRARGGAVI